ncbi:MAG: hypothetical protein QHH01_05455, partial [Spirochaetales bacterium]|nr:hypothetical protein [Spirochaetales bacterium]
MQSILRSLIAIAIVMLPYSAQRIFAQTEMTPLPAATEPLPFVPGFVSPKETHNSFLRRELQMAMLTALAMEEEAVRTSIAGLPSCPEEPYIQEKLRLDALLKELAA